MGNPIFWTGVGVDVQTALATAVNISAISKAATAVVTYGGSTHPSNGDSVLMSVQGMFQVDDRILRIANVNTTNKTFELELEDSTTYDTFISGSYQIVTFGASFKTVQTISPSGGGYEEADLTTIHDVVRKTVPTIAQAMNFEMTNIFDPTDPGFAECNKAFKAKTKRAIRFRFGSGAKFMFNGYVGAAGTPTGQALGVVQTPVSIKAQNLPSIYPT